MMLNPRFSYSLTKVNFFKCHKWPKIFESWTLTPVGKTFKMLDTHGEKLPRRASLEDAENSIQRNFLGNLLNFVKFTKEKKSVFSFSALASSKPCPFPFVKTNGYFEI
jgi:hypothetical protein